ncbi:hypothetical protein A1O7_00804 [Cladophialophora yegresii CBS 114405]|uniref:FAD-binding domain-containing protein n=1 Tax=Cladophialophora yegresii CBS 114405 TaxID=1182544 RepID=W9W956_9EURO|nr:uncharacterized protein A1O7_00804 [Cladophialophora yegresii CBS 114405]EXJ64468.1 hypothetical protein A1O7_00804 [Cladophialophora yegresii CBS 114405]
MASTAFKVVIVGGGVSGLTLANALERAKVEYVLLESKGQFAPAVGASIAIGPNGNRVLDQLGCYDTIERHTDPLVHTRTWKDGKLLRFTDQPVLSHKRLGYPIYFCDRHLLLATLYDNIKDKRNLLLNKRVSRIDHNHKAATVQCKDGTTYTGDVVVGADGVHSIVRQEMFRHLEVNEPYLLAPSDENAMSSEYKCMYGVSKSTSGLDRPEDAGIFNQVLGHDLSFLHSNDKSGRIFWFIFEKLDTKHQFPNIPTFTDDDAVALAHRSSSVQMNDKVRFAEIWENRLAYKLVPLEEGLFRHWTWGRFVCIGDSVHKWTPNIGQGGNNAIESAALLANKLFQLAHQAPNLSGKEVEQAMKSFYDRRLPRAASTFKLANLVTRLEALKSPREEFLILSVIPRVGDWLINQITLGTVGAEKVDYLPAPKRSFQGTMRFNQASLPPDEYYIPSFRLYPLVNYGTGTKQPFAKRVSLALPFLLLSFLAHRIFSYIVAQPALQSSVARSLASGQLEFKGQVCHLPTQLNPFALLVTLFSPSLLDIDPLQKIQAVSFLVDLSPIWLIYILEAHRRANEFKFTFTLPLLYGVAFQLFGIGVVGPIWFFVHYVQSPVADYAAKDWRLVNVAAAKTAGVAVFLAFTIPTLAMYYLQDHNHRLAVNAIWQAFPVLSILLHYVLRKTIVKDTTRHDRIYHVEADMPYTRMAIWSFTSISALVFNAVRYTAGTSLATLFFPDWEPLRSATSSGDGTFDLVSGMRLFLQVDEIVCFGAAFLWLAYLIWDLKEAEMTSVSWIKVAVFAIAGTYLIGPGAVVLLSWWWRENILATKHPKGSVGPDT